MSTHEESHHHEQQAASHPTDAATSDVNKPKVTDWTIENPDVSGEGAAEKLEAKPDVKRETVTDWTVPKPATQKGDDATPKP